MPTSANNLLTNPGFEDGLQGWTVTPSGSTQTSNPAPWEGDQYFYAGSNLVTTVDQTIDLTTSGFTTTQIDTMPLRLTFGGRIRSSSDKSPVDEGFLTLTLFDANNNVIENVNVPAANVTDRWELVGSTLVIPAGARTAQFRFTALLQSGSTNDSYLDGAFLYVQFGTRAPALAPTRSKR